MFAAQSRPHRAFAWPAVHSGAAVVPFACRSVEVIGLSGMLRVRTSGNTAPAAVLLRVLFGCVWGPTQEGVTCDDAFEQSHRSGVRAGQIIAGPASGGASGAEAPAAPFSVLQPAAMALPRTAGSQPTAATVAAAAGPMVPRAAFAAHNDGSTTERHRVVVRCAAATALKMMPRMDWPCGDSTTSLPSDAFGHVPPRHYR